MGLAYAALFWVFVWSADVAVHEPLPAAEVREIRAQVQMDCQQGKYTETLERIEKCGR